MAVINIKSLSDELVRDLKLRAERNNRSLEGEVCHILEGAVDHDKETDDMAAKRVRFLAISDALRRETAGTVQTPAEVLIREDRDHRC